MMSNGRTRRLAGLARILLDHLIRPLEERRRDREAKGLGGLQVDDQRELGGLFYGEIAGFRALEDLVDVGGGAPEYVDTVRPVGHKATRLHVVAQSIHRRQAAPCREVCDSCSMIEEYRVHENDERAGLLAGHRREGAVDLARTTRL